MSMTAPGTNSRTGKMVEQIQYGLPMWTLARIMTIGLETKEVRLENQLTWLRERDWASLKMAEVWTLTELLVGKKGEEWVLFLQSEDRMRGFNWFRDFEHPMGQSLD